MERGLTATVFCVAGRLGRSSDWPTRRADGFVSELATRAEVAELARLGLEVGSHGYEHAPLVGSSVDLQRELVDSQRILEEVTGGPVRTFAFPYGALPSRAARRLVEETYDAACTTVLGWVGPGADLYALPRVEAHYVRRPELLERAVAGKLDTYLRVRKMGAQVRRVFTKDYALVADDA